MKGLEFRALLLYNIIAGVKEGHTWLFCDQLRAFSNSPNLSPYPRFRLVIEGENRVKRTIETMNRGDFVREGDYYE